MLRTVVVLLALLLLPGLSLAQEAPAWSSASAPAVAAAAPGAATSPRSASVALRAPASSPSIFSPSVFSPDASSAAAASPTPHDRFRRPDVRHGGVLELSSQLTPIYGQVGNFSGARLSWVMTLDTRHRTFVGVAGYALTTRELNSEVVFAPCPPNAFCVPQSRKLILDSVYGGLDLRYAYRPHPLFEAGAALTTGPGYVEVNGLVDDHDWFVAIDPEVQVAFRPTRFFALTWSTGYRFATGYDLREVSGDDFSGFSTSVGLQFGWI